MSNDPTIPSRAMPERIAKDVARLSPAPHLLDYETSCAAFSWPVAEAALDWLPEKRGLNMAYEAVDRHLLHGRGGKAALRWLGKSGERRELSFAQLARETNRFANALAALGLQPGERVFVMMGRLPELYVAVLGALKARCVVTPLFSAFGPEPIATRAEIAEARVMVTTSELYQRKVQGLRARLPALQHVILAGEAGTAAPGVHCWRELVEPASDQYVIGDTDPESMALLHFTSGTTGRPKGAIHVHRAVLAHTVTGRYALDLHDDDVFWCTADPGWITGTSYGILAPLCNGVTSVVVEAEFDAQTWYSVLERERVTVWYTAPTAIRMMMKLGAEAVRPYDLSSLRFAASVGEPLNPEAVVWGLEALGHPFHDNWWQTETGGIMIANFAAMDIKPGSMGKPLPGITAAIVRRTAEGGIKVIEQPMVDGELALKTPWPSLMRGYLHVVMGEDVGKYGGCYAVTKGLLEEFGPARIVDTPLAENGFTGVGVGAAIAGLRPIVEIMTCNFSLLALDQILNNAATMAHMSGGQFAVPLVIRMATGAGRQLAAQHSHSLEGWYAHIPGLKVLAPATVEDARHMLAAALADPNPVLIFEHIVLYNVEGEIDGNVSAVDIDHARIRRPGRDVSLVGYGNSLPKCLSAAQELAAGGIDAEVIDLRVLRPLDSATVAASVARTRRCVIVDEGWRSGSVSAELAARLAEECFFDLDAPIRRVCSREVPVPYAAHLEEAALPQVRDIVAAARGLLPKA